MSKLFSLHSSYSRDWHKVFSFEYSLVKGLGTQYRDVSENEVIHFMVLSVRGSRALKTAACPVVECLYCRAEAIFSWTFSEDFKPWRLNTKRKQQEAP